MAIGFLRTFLILISIIFIVYISNYIIKKKNAKDKIVVNEKVNKKRNCHADLPQNEDSAWQFEYVK